MTLGAALEAMVDRALEQQHLQPRLLVRRHPPAAGDRRRGGRARHRRPRPEHGAGVDVRRPAAPAARPHRLLLHRAQLPARLQEAPGHLRAHGAAPGGLADPGRGGQRGLHGGGGRGHHRHRRAPRAVHRPARGRLRRAAVGHRRHLHGRLAEVPRPARRDGHGREVHPPHVPHLGAGRAHGQGHRGPARAHEGRGRGAHHLRLALLHQLQEGRAQEARRRRSHRRALLQAPAAVQLPQPHEDGDHRRQERLLRRHEHGPGVHRRGAALRGVAGHVVPAQRAGGGAVPAPLRRHLDPQRPQRRTWSPATCRRWSRARPARAHRCRCCTPASAPRSRPSATCSSRRCWAPASASGSSRPTSSRTSR